MGMLFLLTDLFLQI